MTTRLKEAQKLGFKQAVLPAAGELDAGRLKLALVARGPCQGLGGGTGPC